MVEEKPKDEAYRCPKEPNNNYFYLCKEDHDKRCKRCSNNSRSGKEKIC